MPGQGGVHGQYTYRTGRLIADVASLWNHPATGTADTIGNSDGAYWDIFENEG